MGAGNIFPVCVKKNKIFNSFPKFVPNIWGWKHISRMILKPNIFNSIPKFVQNIWGWEHTSGMCIKPNIFNSIPKFMPNIWGVETYFWHVYKTQPFQLYPDSHAKHLGGLNIFLGCV